MWRLGFAVVILSVAAAGVVAVAASDDEQPKPTRPAARSTIADFITLPGDQVVTVPNGTYSGGALTAPHPATDGPFGGWLILLAESRGGVVVDQSPPGALIGAGVPAAGDLVLREGTSRVAFVGFRFVDGSLHVDGEDVVLWYTDHTYPTTRWAREPDWPQGDGSPMYHPAPRTMYIGRSARNVRVRGSTIRDTGTAMYVEPGATGTVVEGVTIRALSDGGDPLDPQDVIHPDGVAMVGGNIEGFAIRDSWIRPDGGERTTGIKAIDRYGPITNLVVEDVWLSHATGAGLNLISNFNHGIDGRVSRVRAWKNGMSQSNTVNGVSTTRSMRGSDRITVMVERFSNSAPRSSTTDPATRWRRQNPYDSWSQHLEREDVP